MTKEAGSWGPRGPEHARGLGLWPLRVWDFPRQRLPEGPRVAIRSVNSAQGLKRWEDLPPCYKSDAIFYIKKKSRLWSDAYNFPWWCRLRLRRSGTLPAACSALSFRAPGFRSLVHWHQGVWGTECEKDCELTLNPVRSNKGVSSFTIKRGSLDFSEKSANGSFV